MSVVIRDFRSGDEAAFRDINLEWIERFFAVEDKDRETLNDPKKYYLDPGGAIFMAMDGDDPVGAVALIVMGGGSVELSKMGVRPAAQSKGVGRKLVAIGRRPVVGPPPPARVAVFRRHPADLG